MAQVIKVPEDIVQSWEVQGNLVGVIADYIGVPPNVFEALAEPTGISRDSTASDVAFIEVDEWLALVSSLQVDGGPVGLLGKSKLRQFFSACRVAAFVPEPVPPEADAPEPQPAQPAEGPQLALADTEGAAASALTPPLASEAAAAEEKKEPPKVDKTKVTIEASDGDSSSSDEAAKKKKKSKKNKAKSIVHEMQVMDSLATVKLCEVALQGSEAKVKLIAIAKMKEGKKTYKNKEGDHPEKAEAPHGNKYPLSLRSWRRPTPSIWIVRCSALTATGYSSNGVLTPWSRDQTVLSKRLSSWAPPHTESGCVFIVSLEPWPSCMMLFARPSWIVMLGGSSNSMTRTLTPGVWFIRPKSAQG